MNSRTSSTSMLRSCMTAPGVIEFEDVEIPKIHGDQVLLRIQKVGLCGSDVHVYNGTHPYTTYPVTQGHEFSGVVVELGPNAKNFIVGDRVTAPPQLTCGQCYQCLNGQENICQNLKVIGFQAPGTAQQYFVFPESALIALPRSFSPEKAAMVEPTAVAIHALRRAGDLAGKDIVVLGAGTIGTLVSQLAKLKGARTVLATDICETRLEVARTCGVDHVSKADDESLEAKLAAVFGEKRADIVLECVGAEATIRSAITTARKGGMIVVVGVFGSRSSVDFGLVQDRELQIFGSLMYQRQDFVEAANLLGSDAIQTEPLLGRSFPLKDFSSAYNYLEDKKGAAMKVMIDVD